MPGSANLPWEQITWSVRLATMRFLYRLYLVTIIVLTVGCSTRRGGSSLLPGPGSTSDSPQTGSPIDTQRDAVAAGNQILEDKGGIRWIETPEPVFVERMSYSEAVKQIGLDIAQYDHWPRETQVWLVVFKGRWQLIPFDPNQVNPQPRNYEGCALVLLTAQKGEFMDMGDAVCPVP